ncbi:GerAB/ArcD/ProY family transporter [Pseudobacillus badius]|uniref:GerAB/ArcD/ProY family transporter n=1 Tax=Bacillus badius TaxID=1455 RepID=UPI001CBE30CE|nr:endospore germination permease [Bacillus badius]UAT32920.1 spore germination protein [Bacillus badius]GLY12658.1 hypothetical protein Bbad01_38740 [Bacillus badius]
MNKSDSITPLQVILLGMTAIGLKNHVLAIAPLIETAGRDAWLAVLFTFALQLLWLPLLLYIHRQCNGQPLLVWLSGIIGSRLTKMIAAIFIGYLIIMSSITLRETIDWTGIAYLPETPPFILVILFVFTCWMLASTNLRTVNMANIFLLFFIIILGVFVAVANIQHKNHSLLLPVLEHGYGRVFDAMIYQASGMSEIFLFLLLQHKISSQVRFKHLLAISVVLTGLTLGPLIGAIIEFGPAEASIQRFPPFEEWGIVSIGRFIEHVDFLSIYQWLSGVFIRISLFLLLVKEVLILSPEEKKPKVLLFVSFTVGALTLTPITDFQFNAWLKAFLLPLTFWFFFTFSIFLGVMAIIYRMKKRRVSNEV